MQKQDWYVAKRLEVANLFEQSEPKLNEAKQFESPSKKYSLEVVPYKNESGWGYSRGIVTSAKTGTALAQIDRNFSAFPFTWIEDHPSGHDYLFAGEDYQGQTVIELDTKERVDYIPEDAAQGGGFCWADHNPHPDNNFMLVEGCYWACPYELVLYDISKPMELPYKDLGRWPHEESLGYDADGSFRWRHTEDEKELMKWHPDTGAETYHNE